MRKKTRFEKFIALGVILAMIFQTLSPFTAVVSANAEAEAISTTGEEMVVSDDANITSEAEMHEEDSDDRAPSSDAEIVESAETSSETTETVENTETEHSEGSAEVETASTEDSSPADQDNEEKKLRNRFLAVVAKELGVDLDKNASFYAQHAGIENYRGTREENELLKEYLISNRFSLPNPEESHNAAGENIDVTVANTSNDTELLSGDNTNIENESGVVLENSSLLDEGKNQNSSGNIENTLDKSNWPSMIADRSNEGEALDPNAVLRNANTGKTSIDIREATSDGSEARTEFWVGEQISTNAVIDNSGLGAQLRARGKITFPKAYVNGRPTFVQEKSMRDYAITEDSDNRYVDFKITIDDGKKVALPMFFSMKNNDSVPNRFETPIKFDLFDELTDSPIDSHTTTYTAKTIQLKADDWLYNWMDKGHKNNHGQWDTDAEGHTRVTATDWYTVYEGYTAQDPEMNSYTGWTSWFIQLKPENPNEAPNGWGRSFPKNNKVVINLPEGTVPGGELRDGKYCNSWHIWFCWDYDPQARTMTYEGPFREGNAHFTLKHVNQDYYTNPERTDIKYHKISWTVTTDPATAYAHTFPTDYISIGWKPEIDRVTPGSSISSPKNGRSQSYHEGIVYTPDLSTFDLYYGLYPLITHTLNDANYQKNYTIKSLLDYNLDERLYYKSLRFTYWNVAGYDIATTPHKIMGIRADGGEDLLGENLTAINQVLEINDTQDQYTAIKLLFPDTITTKHLDFDLRVDVAVKESAKAEVEAKVVDQNDRAAWDKKWKDVTDTSWKYFNASKLEYTEQGSDESKYVPATGFIYFKSDYVTSHAWKENGDYVVPYSTDPATQIRDIHSEIEIRKRDHDGSPWTEYSINNMGLNNVKYVALLPEGIQYVPGSVTEKSGKKYGHQIPEPTIIPNYKETGKTALIFDLGNLRKDKPWRSWYFGNPFKFSVFVTNDTAEGNNYVDGYFFRDEEPGYVDVWANFVDKYDFDGDGDITEKFHQIGSTRITYTQRRDVVLKNTLSSSATGNFASSAVLDTVGAKPYYKFNLFNNYIEDMKGLSLITTLPKVNDTAIVPTQDGTYPKRGSELSLNLSGSLEADPNNATLLDKWEFFYSTDEVTADIDATKNANWVPADQITDFAKVTMVKMVQKVNTTVRQKENTDFYLPIALPKQLPDTTKLVTASASTAFSTNGNTYIEGNKINFSFVPHYLIEGKAFADLNDDGSLEGEQGLEGYTVSLFEANGTPVLDNDGNPLSTITDNQGNFFFKIYKRGQYYLTMAKKLVNDQVSKLFEDNGVRVPGNGNDATLDTTDATNMTLKSALFTLDPYTVTSETNIYEKPSSLVAVRNFGLVPKNGQITLKLVDSVDETKIIPGAEFELQNNQGTVLATLTTNEKGEITTDLLPFGEYKFVQKTTTPNYMINTEEKVINLQEYKTSLVHTNTLKKGGLTLTLVDSVDESIVIPNGTFELRNEKGDLVATLTTDAKGKISKTDLPYGNYTITQIATAEHYVVDPQPKTFVLTQDAVDLQVKNTLKKSDLTITLSDLKKPDIKLSQGSFEVYNKKGELVGTGKTNEKGEIVLTQLPYGEYTLKQTEAPKKYKMHKDTITFELFAPKVELPVQNKKKTSPRDPEPEIQITPKPAPDPIPEPPVVPTPEPSPVPQPEPVSPDPIVYRDPELPKTPEVSENLIPSISVEENTKIKTYVKTLPKTGVLSAGDLQKKVGIRKNAKVETDLPNAETFKLAGSTQTALAYWLQVLPKQDQKADQYVVLPKQGLVMPINTVSEKSKAYKNFINGKMESFQSQLHNGAVQLPGTSLGDYGQVGNKVIAGHSSYWKSSSARYKTHFQKIIGMSQGEEVRVYKKTSQGQYQRYVYRVNASYNTDDNDISVLKPTANDQLTLMTCTPIGGVAGRWIVKASFVSN